MSAVSCHGDSLKLFIFCQLIIIVPQFIKLHNATGIVTLAHFWNSLPHTLLRKFGVWHFFSLLCPSDFEILWQLCYQLGKTAACALSSWPNFAEVRSHSPTLLAFHDAEDFAVLAATASFSLRFIVSLLAAEHFRFLALRRGTVCHGRLRRHRLATFSTRHYTFLFTESCSDIRLI